MTSNASPMLETLCVHTTRQFGSSGAPNQFRGGPDVVDLITTPCALQNPASDAANRARYRGLWRASAKE
jgi:hypothetical protein